MRLSVKWNYLLITCPDIHTLLQPLEDTIRTHFIPTLFSRGASNDIECDLFSLPCRLGGLGLPVPSSTCVQQYNASVCITTPLVDLIVSQNGILPPTLSDAQQKLKGTFQLLNRKKSKDLSTSILSFCCSVLLHTFIIFVYTN